MTAQERIDAYLELASEATPKPWKPTEHQVDIGFTQKIFTLLHGVDGPNAFVSFAGKAEAKADAHFIAASRTEGPWLAQMLKRAVEALEFIACEGMDDGDFYTEENVVEGTIAMANRARTLLAELEKEYGQ